MARGFVAFWIFAVLVLAIVDPYKGLPMIAWFFGLGWVMLKISKYRNRDSDKN